MSKPITSRQKAQLWIKQHGGGAVKGQLKEGRGKPSNRWSIVNPKLEEIPDGEPWLLKAKNGDTIRVKFPQRPDAPPPASGVEQADPDADLTIIDLVKQVRDIQKAQQAITASLKDIAYLQKEDLERRRQMAEEGEKTDKTNAEALKAMSMHRLAERVLGDAVTYFITKRQDLRPEDQAFLEAVMHARSGLKAGATIREILASMGLSEGAPDRPALEERKAG